MSEYRRTPDARIGLHERGFAQLPGLAKFFDDFFSGRLPVKPLPGGAGVTISEYLRPRQTAAPVIPVLPLAREVRLSPHIVEQNFGGANGYNDAETARLFPGYWAQHTEALKNGTYHLLRYPDGEREDQKGESQQDVRDRFDLYHIPQMQKDYGQLGIRTHIDFDHGVVAKVSGISMTGRPMTDLAHAKTPGNCDVRLIVVEVGSPFVKDYGFVYADGKARFPGVSPYRDLADGTGPWIYRRDEPLIIPGPLMLPLTTLALDRK